MSIIILGIQSPISVELEETCQRLGLTIEAAIRFGDASRWIDRSVVVSLADFDFGRAVSPFLPCAFAPARRRELTAEGELRGLRRSNGLIDPTAILARSTRVSPLAYINAAAVIGASTLIRTGVFVNRAASIGHHCIIGSFTSIGPGATLASNVTVGDDAIIGAGATICPDVKIGTGAVISAGATVTRNVPDGALVAAPAARILPDAARRTSLRQRTDE
jgi:hypothetical protein